MLRDVKEEAGKTFRGISDETGYSPATLNAACRGDRLPSWTVVLMFVKVCRGDERAALDLYARACREEGREPPGPADPPDPTGAATSADLVSCMRQLRLWAGNPSLAELNRRSGGHLPPSTLSGVLRRDSLPRLDLLGRFVRACDLPDDRVGDWDAAWKAVRGVSEIPTVSADGWEDREQERQDESANQQPPSWLLHMASRVFPYLTMILAAVLPCILILTERGAVVNQPSLARPASACVGTIQADTPPGGTPVRLDGRTKESTGAVTWTCTGAVEAAQKAADQERAVLVSSVPDIPALTLNDQSLAKPAAGQWYMASLPSSLNSAVFVVRLDTPAQRRSAHPHPVDIALWVDSPQHPAATRSPEPSPDHKVTTPQLVTRPAHS